MFDEIKEKILLRNFVQGEKSIKGKRIHVEPCPLCGGHDCFDIMLPGKGGNTHETFKCFQCNQSGSIIDFYCLTNNLNPKNKEDVSKAINNLCNDYGINNNTKGRITESLHFQVGFYPVKFLYCCIFAVTEII